METPPLSTSAAADLPQFTQEQIIAAARALSDRSATACNVNRLDNWDIYGGEFIDDARAALEAAAPASDIAAAPEQQQDHVAPPFAAPVSRDTPCTVCDGKNYQCPHCDGMGIEPRKVDHYGDCTCILSKYCDGKCNPVFTDQLAGGFREGRNAQGESVAAPGSATAGAAAKPGIIGEALKVAKDLAALVGKQDHLIDYSAVTRGRGVIEAAIAAYGSAEVSPPDGAMPELPAMRAAFKTLRCNEDAEFTMVFKFPSLAALHQANNEWHNALTRVAAQPAEGSAQVATLQARVAELEVERNQAADNALALLLEFNELRERIAAPERSDTPAADAAGRAYREQQINSDEPWESLSANDRAGWINDAQIAASQALDIPSPTSQDAAAPADEPLTEFPTCIPYAPEEPDGDKQCAAPENLVVSYPAPGLFKIESGKPATAWHEGDKQGAQDAGGAQP